MQHRDWYVAYGGQCHDSYAVIADRISGIVVANVEPQFYNHDNVKLIKAAPEMAEVLIATLYELRFRKNGGLESLLPRIEEALAFLDLD
jgi:hypothetical protein